MLPLTPAVFHILLALADGEKHGYAIMQEVEAISEKRVKMGPGTLYGSIKRMLEAGLIEEAGEQDEDNERRRYYRLTPFGDRVLSAEGRRLATLVNAFQTKRGNA
jgi:DNA-binding PadR family transcriptional regulator